MPNRVSPGGWTADDAAKVVALDTKVGMLDADVKEVHTRLTGLETKFDNVAEALGHEFRSGMASVGKMINERGSTKWSVIFTGLGVAASVAIAIGGQALSPIWANVNELKANVVPRTEVEFRYSINNKRLDNLEADARSAREHRELTLSAEIDRLRRQNADIREDLRRANVSPSSHN